MLSIKLTNFAPSNTSIMPNKILLTNLEQLLSLDGLNLRLRVYSAKYIARYLSQIGQIGNFYNPKTLQKTITGATFYQNVSLR